MGDSDHETDEITIPRAAMNKMIKELCPQIRVANEARYGQNLTKKLGQQSAIYWNSHSLCRDYFFRNNIFFVFQDRKLKLSASV